MTRLRRTSLIPVTKINGSTKMYLFINIIKLLGQRLGLFLLICDSLYEKGPLHALNQFAERQFESSKKKKKFFFLIFFFLTRSNRTYQVELAMKLHQLGMSW